MLLLGAAEDGVTAEPLWFILAVYARLGSGGLVEYVRVGSMPTEGRRNEQPKEASTSVYCLASSSSRLTTMRMYIDASRYE